MYNSLRLSDAYMLWLSIIDSDNGLSPGRRQAIMWTNAGILLIGPLGTNFSKTLIVIYTFPFKKMHLKLSSGKWRPFCLSLNVLKSLATQFIFLSQHGSSFIDPANKEATRFLAALKLWFNSSSFGQHGHLFADNIFRCIFMNEKLCILIKISLKFVCQGQIDNNPALVQIMAWHKIGAKPLSEPMLNRFTDTYMRY